MGTKFADFFKEIEEEARLEGPQAENELAILKEYFAAKVKKALELGNNSEY
jgi:hypothetical protein